MDALDALLLAIQHSHSLDPITAGWRLFGCFSSTLDPDDGFWIDPSLDDAYAEEWCFTQCINDENAAAGDFLAIYVRRCYCSVDPPEQDTSMTSKGSRGLAESFDDEMFVFQRIITAEPGLRAASLIDWNYAGCFAIESWLDSMNDADFFVSVTEDDMDAARCSIICAGDDRKDWTILTVEDNNCHCTIPGYPISLDDQMGDGHCSHACSGEQSESCGGRSSISGVRYGTSYARRPNLESNPENPTPGTPHFPLFWYDWGCYFGGAYLLDSVITGRMYPGLHDEDYDNMYGERCINYCESNEYTYAMTLSGICYCNKKPPRQDLMITDQAL